MTQLQDVKYLAERLNVTKCFVYQLISDGRIAPPIVFKVGRKIVVNPEYLDEWILKGGHMAEKENVEEPVRGDDEACA